MQQGANRCFRKRKNDSINCVEMTRKVSNKKGEVMENGIEMVDKGVQTDPATWSINGGQQLPPSLAGCSTTYQNSLVNASHGMRYKCNCQIQSQIEEECCPVNPNPQLASSSSSAVNPLHQLGTVASHSRRLPQFSTSNITCCDHSYQRTETDGIEMLIQASRMPPSLH